MSDKNLRLNRAAVARTCILFVFPVITLFFGGSWVGTWVSLGLSVLAAGIDRVRHQRRSMSFPLFLLIVWGGEILVFSLILNFAYLYFPVRLPVLNLEDPSIALAKWAEFDRQKALLPPIVWSVELNSTDFPWLVEFPPLTVDSPPPLIKTVSVILAAHNEHKYLERTINSIIENSPPNELVEIIVVDDASDPPLSEITDKMAAAIVKVVRRESRQGLIRSKTDGAAAAAGDLVVFLDAHVKPEPNWLVPLFRHTNENYKRVVTPVIPILNGESWQIDSKAVGIKMMFDWALGFNWFDDGNDWVPIMSGGLLAITRRWWHEGGEYDTEMLMWGGENIEQSVRTWLCGGEIVVARDSRVSHVFRPSFPYAINHTQVNINKVRTVEVWFDEYREFFYRSDPYARTLTAHKGPVTDRLLLQQRLGCKPFQYFVDRFRAVFDMKNMLPKRHVAIKDEKTGKCLESNKEGWVVFGNCANAIGNDYRAALRFVPDFPATPPATSLGTIRSLKLGGKCFDANGQVPEKKNLKILLYTCMAKNSNQEGWVVEAGGLRWGQWCAFMHPTERVLSFGECVSEEGEEFLGKSFRGHPDHRFVIADERSMDIAKSDKDLPKEE